VTHTVTVSTGSTLRSSDARYEKVRRFLKIVLESPALRVFVVTRFGLMLCMFLSMAALPMVSNEPWRGAPDNLVLDGWARWDSGWYMHIADDGYNNRPNEAGQRDTAFFPLYPLLVRAASPLVGGALHAGILVSNIASALGFVFLFGLVEQKVSRDVAWRATALMAVFPFGFFLSSIYTESVFFLGTVGAFYWAERRRWWLVALFGIAVGATKTVGVFLCVPLAALYMQQRDWSFRRLDRSAPAVAAPFLGFLGFVVFLFVKFSEPLAFATAQDAEGWSVHASSAARLVSDLRALLSPHVVLAGDFIVTDVLCIASILWALPLTMGTWRALGLPYAIWTFIVTLSALGSWMAFPRFCTTMFPLFITMAKWLRRDGAFLSVGFVWTLLLALLSILYAHFFWVA